MDKYIYDDKNDLWYELQGDYYIPCLILPAEKEQPIGVSERIPQSHLHNPAYEWQTKRLPCRHRQASTEAFVSADKADCRARKCE